MSSKIILSLECQNDINAEGMINHLCHFNEQLKMDLPVFSDLPISRAHKKGVFEDNPPIAQLDQIQNLAHDHSIPLISLSLPINFQHSSNLGDEISLINGWTDMASYMGLELIRVFIHNSQPDLSYEQKSALKIMLDYMNDMDMNVNFVNTKNQTNLENSLYELITLSNHAGFERLADNDTLPKIGETLMFDNTIQTLRYDINSDVLPTYEPDSLSLPYIILNQKVEN